MTYTIDTRVDGEFEQVVDRVETALGEEGFGVLSDIDVQATLAEKLDVETDRYRILGACNPPLAQDGLEADQRLGALLPCNVVVYEDDGAVAVSAVDPEVMLSVVDDPTLDAIATDVRERFERVVASLAE